MIASASEWYRVANGETVLSPALLIYPERVEENIERMLAIAGGPERLRPHMKTHKMPEIIRLQLSRGITKFKCATIAEAEMVARCGAPDILLAYQPVGPNVARLAQLVVTYPQTKFMTIADDPGALQSLSKEFAARGLDLEALLDLDCGMRRTGIFPGPDAAELYRFMAGLPGIKAGGLHSYDGHIRDSDLQTRIRACDAAFDSVLGLQEELAKAGLPVPRIVAGGTPTFPVHARRAQVECSPGTCLLWDFGYGDLLPDLPFLYAALVLTRIVSKPASDLLCLDLGHKAIASENPHPRVRFPDLPGAEAVSHSEEHLVVKTARAEQFAVGDCLYGIPRHICPTCALHSDAIIVRNGRAQEKWKILARDRVLRI